MLGRFFDATKAYAGKLRFLLLAGVMKFSSADLFSGFNIVSDASLDPEFGDLLGFTEDEILSYFGGCLLQAAEALAMPLDMVLETMRRACGGFCFDEAASTQVYAPGAALAFLKDPRQGLSRRWLPDEASINRLAGYFKASSIQRTSRPMPRSISRFSRAPSVRADSASSTPARFSFMQASRHLLTIR